ncbi:MAG TPA: hypothetical protein VFJ82_08360 [Longimicrobium sp.]|nr:hypothetical protein [Longimicrobium sp.]
MAGARGPGAAGRLGDTGGAAGRAGGGAAIARRACWSPTRRARVRAANAGAAASMRDAAQRPACASSAAFVFDCRSRPALVASAFTLAMTLLARHPC